ESSGSSPDQAATEPFSSAVFPSAWARFCTVTSDSGILNFLSVWRRKKYGSVPLAAAIDLPLRSATVLIDEPFGTRIADQSGWSKTSIALMGDPFDRASRAAEPAVDPTSRAPARRAWFAVE